MPRSAANSEDRASGSDDLGFVDLRRLGIRLAQKLSGDRWTDYNLHDPGVTLLEQFCYALTDLDHRVDFDIADHLSSSDGEIDYAKLGLVMPEDIFSSRTTTLKDYRRTILDRVPEVDDVRVNPIGTLTDQGGSAKGLYQILLRPHPGASEDGLTGIRSKVDALYNSCRNLCEDVEEIAFVQEIDCVLRAEVEVGRKRAPEEILAEIYHQCAEHIAARVPIHPLERARRKGGSLEEAFTGPRILHGFFEETDLERGKTTFEVSEFFGLVDRIEGVDHVRDLYFEVEGKAEPNAIGFNSFDRALRLITPALPDGIGVRLSCHGRSLQVSFDVFRKHVDAWETKRFGTDPCKQDVHKLYSKPRGEYRDLSSYTSVQTQLPVIYGLATSDLPDAATSVVRGQSRRVGDGGGDWADYSVKPAQARQLKGYLVLFDQLMANYTQSIERLKDLYSPAFRDSCTYSWQVLDGRQISGLDKIYPPEPEEEIKEVVARYDNAKERKGRLLNYLLALYGEGFSQGSIQAFNSYATVGERQRGFVENKARYLRDIARITRDRGAAVDYRASARAGGSGLQHRVSYLLGFAGHRPRSLTEAFSKHDLRPVAHGPSADSDEERALPPLCSREDFDPPENAWEAEVPLKQEERRKSLKQLMKDCGNLLPGREDGIPGEVLSRGISLANYRLGHRKGHNDDWRAFLLSGDEAHCWQLGSFGRRDEAVEKVNELRRLIRWLNVKSEGMHLIEHILLRPREPKGSDDIVTRVADSDFYSLRLSVVFPAWTARFQDSRFRQLAKETVCLNCPAHIVPQVFWLGFEDMTKLEELQHNWRSALSGDEDSGNDLNFSGKALREFLIARESEECWDLSSDSPPTAEKVEGAQPGPDVEDMLDPDTLKDFWSRTGSGEQGADR